MLNPNKKFGRFKIISYLCIRNKKRLEIMGMFCNYDKKSYCGKYKGIDIWQYGCIIGYNWYGDYYVTIPRGVTKRDMKVKDSVCRSLEAVKKYIDNHLEELKNKSAK